MTASLQLTRDQILSYRRAAGSLDRRLPQRRDSLRRAAWSGLQDSMPRAAVLSIHARLEATAPTVLDDPALVQVWGPRFSAFAVAVEDVGVFTLGRMPDSKRSRERAESLAARIRDLLGDTSMTYSEAGRLLGVDPNQLRYATTTGTVIIEWDGARRPTIRSVPPPDMEVSEARLELVRRYLHVFGVGTPASLAQWAGVREPVARQVFERLREELVPVATPIGDAWLLASDEREMRSKRPDSTAVRLLPSGDAYYLLWGADRDLLVPDPTHRDELWTSRVWPGAVLAAGEVVGTWRRSQHLVTIQPWRSLDAAVCDRIAEEATSLPLPHIDREIVVEWSG